MAMPKILWIYREDVKPAKGISHEKVESEYARLWERAGVQPYLSLNAVSGDADETLFISGYDSFAALEKDYKTFDEVSAGPLKSNLDALAAQEAGLLNGAHSSIAVYRPDLSYLGQDFHARLPKSRYLNIESFHTRLGKGDEFAEGAKAYQEAYRELHIENPWVVYQLMSGGPQGTYLVISEMNSLSDMDAEMARQTQIDHAVNSKSKDLMKHMDEAFLSMQTNIYRLNPKTSYVSEAFASEDPSFWRKPISTSGGIQVLARTDFSTDTSFIRRAQQALSSKGYSIGSIDGVAGKQTRSAVRLFQKDSNLPITGMIDKETADKLGI